MSAKASAAAFYPMGFAGDPASQTGEGTAPAFGPSRTTGMAPRQRLTSPMNAAAPVQQLTPDQKAFRANAVGRWQADVPGGATAPAYGIKRHPDGTMDVVRLEADGSSWIDLGGQGGRDVAAGRAS